jgi:hypothetical protein
VKSALLPLVMLWLAAHALLLGLILALKFLGAKMILLLAMMGTAAWFLLGRRKPLRLPAA